MILILDDIMILLLISIDWTQGMMNHESWAQICGRHRRSKISLRTVIPSCWAFSYVDIAQENGLRSDSLLPGGRLFPLVRSPATTSRVTVYFGVRFLRWNHPPSLVFVPRSESLPCARCPMSKLKSILQGPRPRDGFDLRIFGFAAWLCQLVLGLAVVICDLWPICPA